MFAARPLVKLVILLFVVIPGLFSIPPIAQAEPERPVVIIPGIMGSRMVDTRNGDLLWGSARALRELERLTVADGPRDPDPNGVIQPQGLIQEVVVFGPIKVKQYNILRDALHRIGYQDGVTYFEFPYDWRQSNFTSAEQLSKFIEATPELNGREFDIIAHSMGGLIAQVYAKTLDTDEQVRRIIFFGTPFRGSMNTYKTLEEGWSLFENWLAGGEVAIRRFALSMPSFYELLPEYPNCCRLGGPGDSMNFDARSNEGSEALDWLPPGQRLTAEAVGRAVMAARRMGDIVDQPFPSYVTPFVFAGSGLETYLQAYVDPATRSITKFVPGDGDGTVPEWSATNGRPHLAFVSLASHATIFEDPNLLVQMRRILTGSALPENRNFTTLAPFAKSGALVEIEHVAVVTRPSVINEGETAQLEIIVQGAEGDPVWDLPLTFTVMGQTTALSGEQLDDLPGVSRAVYASPIGPIEMAGGYEIEIGIEGVNARLSDFIAVVPNE